MPTTAIAIVSAVPGLEDILSRHSVIGVILNILGMLLTVLVLLGVLRVLWMIVTNDDHRR